MTLLVTQEQAQEFLIRHHHLDAERTLSGKQGILDYMRKVGCIQYDPLNVVGYNPELVLQSRIDDFNTDSLYELLYQDRMLYDTWDKNMSICLVGNWSYFERTRNRYKDIYLRRLKGHENILDQVRNFIRNQSPVTSGDLDLDKKINWPWGPTRMARAVLESMFSWGELIIYNKRGARKAYDFSKNYIEKSILDAKDPNLSDNAYYQRIIISKDTNNEKTLKWTETARLWSKMYNADIKPEDINCGGCKSKSEPLFNHCHVCDIRKCGLEKQVANCAYCNDFPCVRIEAFFKVAPEAKNNLNEIKFGL